MLIKKVRVRSVEVDEQGRFIIKETKTLDLNILRSLLVWTSTVIVFKPRLEDVWLKIKNFFDG